MSTLEPGPSIPWIAHLEETLEDKGQYEVI